MESLIEDLEQIGCHLKYIESIAAGKALAPELLERQLGVIRSLTFKCLDEARHYHFVLALAGKEESE